MPLLLTIQGQRRMSRQLSQVFAAEYTLRLVSSEVRRVVTVFLSFFLSLLSFLSFFFLSFLLL